MKTVQDKNLLEMPIGVFDSGMGGLTVMREIMRQIPNEKVIYFGDTARVPYGSKSKETVTRFSRQIVRFLQSKQVKAIVVACNTASAYALDDLEKEIDIPIIGVVKPGAKVAAGGNPQRTGRRHCDGRDHQQQYLYDLHPPASTGGTGNRQGVPTVCAAGGRRTLAGSGDGRDRKTLLKQLNRYRNRHSDSWLHPLSADPFDGRKSDGRPCDTGKPGV